MPTRLIVLIIMLLTVSTAVPAAADGDVNADIARELSVLRKSPDDMAALDRLCTAYLNKADFNSAIKYGERLQTLAYDKRNYYKYVIYSHVILGEAYTMKGDRQLAFDNLGQAEKNARTVGDDSIMSRVCNASAIYYVNMLNDTYRALTYLFRGLESAKRSGYANMYNILLSNIAEVYYQRGDTTGLKYAIECHSRGRAAGNEVLVFHSSISAAYLYCLKGQLEIATRYLDECSALMERHHFHDRAQVFNIRGMVELRRNRPSKALEWFSRSLAEQADGSVPGTACAYLGYGRALSASGRQAEAVDYLRRGVVVARMGNSNRYLPQLLLAISECEALRGDKDEALRYYKMYHECTDTLYSAEKERAVGDMRAKYDTERQENLLKQQQIDLMHNRTRTLILLALLAVAVVATSLLYVLYRRKNILYKAIVQQNRSAIRREESLRLQLDECRNAGKYASSSLTGDRIQTLYARLETLMDEQKPYRDRLLTKDKVAEMLDTNRTYLSQAINEQTGQTFTAYIGALRIKDAVRLLSDPKNDTPLKAVCSEVGFSSMTTFYNQFQQTTGMTPATYRQKVVEMG